MQICYSTEQTLGLTDTVMSLQDVAFQHMVHTSVNAMRFTIDIYYNYTVTPGCIYKMTI